MSDNNGSRPIIEPIPSTEAAADVKKLTMKGLKLELDDLVDFIEGDVLGKLVEIANAIQQIRDEPIPKLSTWCSELDTATKELKDAQTTLSSNQAILQEGLYVLSDLSMKAKPPTPQLDQIPEQIKEPEPEPPQEPEPEPEQLQFGTHQHVVLETIADSCIVMNDILLLCKAMKKVSELTDQTRIALLDLAGRRAGIEIQPGMQVRAGVKMIVT